MARTKAYLVVALATVLSMVGSLVAPFAQQHVALAGDQAWELIASPSRVNQGAIITPLVANDGTVFIGGNTVGTGVSNSIRSSTNGGSSFSNPAVAPSGVGASPIVDLAVSPTFGTDRTIFALCANRIVYGSTDGGATWTAVGAAATLTAAITPVRLAISPNYTSGSGILLVSGISLAGLSNAVDHINSITLVSGTGFGVPAWAVAYGAVAATLGDAAGEGITDILFSPNYVSDGTIIAILTAAAGAPLGVAVGAVTAELRSVNGAVIANPVTIAALFTGAGSARAALPAGYSPTSADNYFAVLNNGANGAAAGFYRRSAGAWTQTATAAAVDLVSVSSSGSFASAIVVVGERTLGQTRRSGNGGTTFAAVAAVLGGTGPVFVALSQNFTSDNTVYAANGGAGGGFWRSTTGGGTTASYTGVGLHTSNFTTVTGFATAPNFTTSSVALLVGNIAGAGNSVFRSSNFNAISAGTGNSGASWSKVSTMTGVTTVGISSGFATDNTVWIADNAGNMQKSADGGNSFSGAFITQNPVPVTRSGNGIFPVNANTLFIVGGQTAGNLNQVVKSTDSGISYTITTITGLQNITSFGLSPAYATDSTIAVAGLTPSGLSQVYWSKDGGATFTQVGANLTTSAGTGTQVTFSDMYATDKAIFASANHATAGEVYRWIDGTSTAWSNMRMSGITVAAGAAYVPGLAGFTSVGNIGVAGGVLYASRTTVGVHAISRALTPAANPTVASPSIAQWLDLQWVARGGVGIFAAPGSGSFRQALIRNPGTSGLIGVAGGAVNVGLGPDAVGSTADDGLALSGVVQLGLSTVSRSATTNQVIGINTNIPAAGPIEIVSYNDNQISAPALSQPADRATVPLPGQAVGHPQITWQPYGPVILAPSFTGYLIRFSASADFSDQVNTTYGVTSSLTTTPAAAGALAGAPAFLAGTTYYYQLAVVSGVTAGTFVAAGAAIGAQTMDVVSPWTAIKSYGSAAGVPNLLTPVSAPGLTTVVPSKQITFNWQAVALATDYRLGVSGDGIIDPLSTVGAYRNPVIVKLVGSASPSYTLTAAEAALLQDNAQYFWQVQAIFGPNSGNYTNLSAQAGASGFFRTPQGTTTSTSASVAMASLINTANPSASLLSIAWAQDTTTGAFQFLAPGVGTSTLTTLQPNTALFLNLTATSRLRISGRDPITVPAGGRWIALGNSTLVELVP